MHDIVTQRLNQFLVEKNITYKELSGMILMSETSLCRKLTGSRSLDLHTLISIVACLPDVSSEWLLRGKGRVCNSSSSISSDVLVEELKMENNLLKRKIQVLQELLLRCLLIVLMHPKNLQVFQNVPTQLYRIGVNGLNHVYHVRQNPLHF